MILVGMIRFPMAPLVGTISAVSLTDGSLGGMNNGGGSGGTSHHQSHRRHHLAAFHFQDAA